MGKFSCTSTNLSMSMVTSKMRNYCDKIRNYWKEFCSYSSVHGLQYFGENRTIIERIWWFLAIATCIVVGCFSVHQVYMKWEENVVIISPDNKETSVVHIPFPTITICPQKKFVNSKVNNLYKNNLVTITGLIIESMESFSPIVHYSSMDFEQHSDNDIYEVMDKATPSYYIFVREYGSSDAPDYFHHSFTKIITKEGICLSYNLLNNDKIFKEDVLLPYHDYTSQNCEKKWTLEGGFDEISCPSPPQPGYFKISTSSLRDIGLEFIIFGSENDGNTEYVIKLDMPLNIPQVNKNELKLSVDRSLVLNVEPVVVTASDYLRKYSPKTRGCHFQSDRSLKYFQNYTASNCKLECLTNYTLHYCGCVAFYMPHSNLTTICRGFEDHDCMKHASDLMRLDDWIREFENSPTLGKELDTITNERSQIKEKIPQLPQNNESLNYCQCIPSCYDLSYSVHTAFEGDVKVGNYLSMMHIGPSDDKNHIGALTVKFASSTFVKSERRELYGPSDFLAYFGGLLGLFLGFSVMSFFEICYFLTVRPFANRYLYGHYTGAHAENLN